VKAKNEHIVRNDYFEEKTVGKAVYKHGENGKSKTASVVKKVALKGMKVANAIIVCGG
jgi:hypothetical protein